MKITKKKIKLELKSFIIALIVVFAFRTVFFEPYRVPSGSMIPSIMIGDFLVVNKMAYGLKVPYSEWKDKPIYLMEYAKPKKGEVIVFKYPKNPSINFIKRVVGVPGDRIKIINKEIYINGKKMFLKEEDIERSKKIIGDLESVFKEHKLKMLKTKTGNKIHDIIWNDDNLKYSNMEEIVVPKNHYFVMGDNRDFSADSRFWGFVPFDNIKGRASFVWFSLSAKMFGDTSDGGFKSRLWRIGTTF